MTWARSHRGEAGTTLIELLVAVVIMGICFVAIVGGVGAAIIGADSNRRSATSGVVLTSAAETLVADTTPYEGCAGTSTYGVPPAPPGYTVTLAAVMFWDPGLELFVATCPAPDSGIQLLRLKLVAPTGPRAGESESLEVVKRQPEVAP